MTYDAVADQIGRWKLDTEIPTTDSAYRVQDE
jgi:hypothetical protein